MKLPKVSLSQRHGAKPLPGKSQSQSPPHQPGIAQPKMAIASHMKKQPVAPPAYRPQSAPKTMQPKMAGGLQQPQAVNQSPQPMTASMSRTRHMTAVVQPKSLARPSTVIQCKNCLSCPHKAHKKDCTVLVATASGGTKACGCKSHSIKFDKSQKFNPGGGKRERMLANKIK